MSKMAKAGLKEVRELIKQKEYKDAIRKCKSILKEDKNNYIALVLLGAAMQELDEFRSQAPLALKKASEIQPDNTLAWQGLVAFYEREKSNPSTLAELITAHCKLLQIDGDPAKFKDILKKITNLCLELQDDEVYAEVVLILQQQREVSNGERLENINANLAKLLTEYTKQLDKYSSLLENVLADVCKDVDAPNHQEYYKKFLKMLYKSGKLDTLLSEAAIMHEIYTDDSYPLEWICRIYSEQNISSGSCDGLEILPFCESLLALNTASSMALMAKAVNLFNHSNYIGARDGYNQVIALKPQWIHPWLALAEVNLKLYCYGEAERAAITAEKLIKPDTAEELQKRIKLILIEATIESSNSKAIENVASTLEDILDNASVKLELLLARAHVYMKSPKALNLIEKLEDQADTKAEATVLRALLLKNDNRLEEAADVLGAALESSEAWLLLGKIHWELSDYSHSSMAFLKGVQADPYNWECFVYLGKYYQQHGNDLERSRKCYQKALQINPCSEEAGIGLSTAYRRLKNSDANMQLLQSATRNGTGPKWAWLQLGLHYLEQGDPNKAIDALRIVIRNDPNDSHCWEMLADAYLARGALTSALKSYQRVLELNTESLYSLIQIANIKLMLYQFSEAKQDFELVLSLDSHYVPALRGLAETLLGLSKDYASKQLLGRAREMAQLCADHLTSAIVENSNLSCIWKLLGDACYFTASLPKKYCFLKVAAGLVRMNSGEEFVTIQRTDIFSLSNRCYCRALTLSPASALLWHDLACGYLAQLRTNSAVDRVDIANKSVAAAKHAIRLSPSFWSHWNLLGVISMTDEVKNYALAQHCYIMAIDMESNNATAWSNLGTLYLHLGDVYRANKAFSRAQRSDPAYINSWIGQALIAEELNRKEVMDLFRHTTQLGYHGEAALGYTHWVLTTLLDPEAKKDSMYTYTIENMHAIPVAIDLMTWYIEHVHDNPYAWNALGLLLERKRMYKLGAKAFSTALEMTNKDVVRDSLVINLARVLIQLKEYDESVRICRTIKNADFNSHCQLAMSLFKAEKYEESYGAYEEALHWLAGGDADKAHILCAMAAMAYMFEGVEDAKTLLFQCIQIQPPTISGLFATAALGLLHKDLNLAALVLKELKPFHDHPEHRNQITFLLAYMYADQNDHTSATRILCKSVHRHPGDVDAWVLLVRFLFDIAPEISGNCAEKALLLGRKNCTDIVARVSCASTISQLISEKKLKGFKSAQKIVHSFPYMVESWASFIASLLPRCGRKDSIPSAHWLTVLIANLRRHLTATRPMSQWLSNNERKSSLLADQIAAL